MRLFLFLAALLMAGATFVDQADAELIFNPGFEDTDLDGNFGDGWGTFGAAGFNAFFGANGHASFFLDNPDNSGGIFQSGIVGSFGNEYTFTLDDVLIESNAAAATFSFGLEFFASDDATLISNSLAAITLTPGGGLSFSHTALAPVGTAFVRPIVSFSGASGLAEGSENVFAFGSSLTATAIPEPSAMILVTAASVAGLARSRIKRLRFFGR